MGITCPTIFIAKIFLSFIYERVFQRHTHSDTAVGYIIIISNEFPITTFVLALGFGTMYLWNWLVPSLFHGPVITFWQTVGILILSKILFGGFGKHGGGKPQWRDRMKEKINRMSPEEKEAFKARFKAKCGRWYNDVNDVTE